MTRHSIPAVLLVGSLAAAGAACDVHVGDNGVSVDVASGKATQDWSRNYTLAAGGTLDVTNTNGTIEVEAADGAQVEVKATVRTRASSDEDAQSLLKNIEIKEEVASPKEVRLRTTVAGGLLLGRRSQSVEYHIKVPAGMTVKVKTDNGGINLRNVSGALSALTTNGGVRGSNLSGSVSAHAVNGGLVIDVARVAGPIDMDVVNGGIRLDIPPDAKVDINAHTVNGPVVLDRALTLAGDQGRGRVTGTLNGGGQKITVNTVNGSVRINARNPNAPQARSGNDREDDDEEVDVNVVVPRKN
jgi:DUF4097 and DUF4098 domain-containing protein YvlB